MKRKSLSVSTESNAGGGDSSKRFRVNCVPASAITNEYYTFRSEDDGPKLTAIGKVSWGQTHAAALLFEDGKMSRKHCPCAKPNPSVHFCGHVQQEGSALSQYQREAGKLYASP